MSILRRLCAITVATALAASGIAGVAASPAHAADGTDLTDRPPVAVADVVTAYQGDQREIDLLSNDTDPDGDVLAVCRLGRSARAVRLEADSFVFDGEPTPLGIGTTYLVVGAHAAAGTYTISYQACDTALMTAGVVTVHVRHLRHVTVQRTARPRYVRVHNPTGFRADFFWSTVNGVRFGSTTIPAHHTAAVHVAGATISWRAETHVGLDGTVQPETPHALGSGVVRHIATPTRGATARATLGSASSARRTTGTPFRPPADASVARVTWPAATFTNPDPATTQAPTTGDDAATVWSGNGSIAVLDNDTDPEGVGLDVCRLDLDSLHDSGLVPRIYDGRLALDSSHAAAGTYTLTYYACNAHRLTPGVVTVTVQRTQPLTVKVVPGHRSKVLVTNPNDAAAGIFLDANVALDDLTSPLDDGSSWATIPANASRYVAFHHRWGSWDGLVGCGGDAGHGPIRNVPLTRADAITDTSTRRDGITDVISITGC